MEMVFENALAEKLFVKPKEIIIGNGSNELLDIAVRTFLAPGDEAVMAHPSFVVYAMAVQAEAERQFTCRSRITSMTLTQC